MRVMAYVRIQVTIVTSIDVDDEDRSSLKDFIADDDEPLCPDADTPQEQGRNEDWAYGQGG